MLLNLDKFEGSQIAAIDSDGNKLSYGDILNLSDYLKKSIPKRAFVFILTENNVGGIAWVMATIL